jgi:hypothetical protein
VLLYVLCGDRLIQREFTYNDGLEVLINLFMMCMVIFYISEGVYERLPECLCDFTFEIFTWNDVGKAFIEFCEKLFFVLAATSAIKKPLVHERNWKESGFQDSVSISLNIFPPPLTEEERQKKREGAMDVRRRFFKMRTVQDTHLQIIYPNSFVVTSIIETAKREIKEDHGEAAAAAAAADDDDDDDDADWSPGASRCWLAPGKLTHRHSTGPFLAVHQLQETKWSMLWTRAGTLSRRIARCLSGGNGGLFFARRKSRGAAEEATSAAAAAATAAAAAATAAVDDEVVDEVKEAEAHKLNEVRRLRDQLKNHISSVYGSVFVEEDDRGNVKGERYIFGVSE